jgi:hypothetical protein
MRAPIYPIIVALVLMLVAAPSFSAFAQRGERDRILEERTPLRTPEERGLHMSTHAGALLLTALAYAAAECLRAQWGSVPEPSSKVRRKRGGTPSSNSSRTTTPKGLEMRCA